MSKSIGAEVAEMQQKACEARIEHQREVANRLINAIAPSIAVLTMAIAPTRLREVAARGDRYCGVVLAFLIEPELRTQHIPLWHAILRELGSWPKDQSLILEIADVESEVGDPPRIGVGICFCQDPLIELHDHVVIAIG